MQIYEEKGDTAKLVESLDWLASHAAVDLYGTEAPNGASIIQKKIEILERAEGAKISKLIENCKFRLGSESILEATERINSEIIHENSNLTELYRETLVLNQDNQESAEKLIKRLFITGEEVDYLNDLILKYKNPTSSKIKLDFSDFDSIDDYKSIDNEKLPDPYQSCLWGSTIDVPADILKRSPFCSFARLNSTFYDANYEQVLTTFDYLTDATTFMNRKFRKTYDKMMKRASILKLLSWIKLGINENAHNLFHSMNLTNEECLDDFLFNSIVEMYESVKNFSAVVDLIELKLIDFAPEEPSIILVLIKNLVNLKRFNEALEYCEAVLSSFASDDPSALFYKGLIYWESGIEDRHDKSKCLSNLLSSAKSDPTRPETFLYLGRYYFEVESNLVKAERCLLKSLSLSMQNNESSIILGQIFLDTNRFTEAKDLLEPLTKTVLRNSQLWLVLGIACYKTGEFPRSSICFQNALKSENAKEKICLAWLGDSFMKEKKLSSALKTLTRLVSVDPDNIFSLNRLANAYVENEDFMRALDIFEKLIFLQTGLHDSNSAGFKIYFDYLRCLLLYSRKLFKASMFQLSLDTAKKAIEVASTILHQFKDAKDCALFWIVLSDIIGFVDGCKFVRGFDSKFDMKEIEMRFERVIRLVNPGLTEIQNCLEEEEEEEGLEEESNVKWRKFSCKAILRALSCQSDSKVISLSLWISLSVSLFKLGELVDGLTKRLYQYSISAASNFFSEAKVAPSELLFKANLVLAMSYWKLGNSRKAQHHFIGALKIEPENSIGWINLGVFYQSLGDFELAEQAYERAIISDPDNSSAYISKLLLSEALASTKIDTETTVHSISQRLAESLEFIPILHIKLITGIFQVLKSNNQSFTKYLEFLELIKTSLLKLIDFSSQQCIFYELLGMVLIVEKNFWEANKHFKSALELNPKSSRISRLIEECSGHLGITSFHYTSDFSKALCFSSTSDWRGLVNFFARKPVDSLDVGSLKLFARALFEIKDYPKCTELISNLLKRKDETDLDCLNLLALCSSQHDNDLLKRMCEELFESIEWFDHSERNRKLLLQSRLILTKLPDIIIQEFLLLFPEDLNGWLLYCQNRRDGGDVEDCRGFDEFLVKERMDLLCESWDGWRIWSEIRKVLAKNEQAVQETLVLPFANE